MERRIVVMVAGRLRGCIHLQYLNIIIIISGLFKSFKTLL